MLDHFCYEVVRGDNILRWDSTQTEPLTLQRTDLGLVRKEIDEIIKKTEYFDCHHWTFTPKSFALLIQDLRELGYHNLSDIGSFETAGFEFFISLSKSSTQCIHRDRLKMLFEIEEEMNAIVHAPLDLSIYAFAKMRIISRLQSLKRRLLSRLGSIN